MRFSDIHELPTVWFVLILVIGLSSCSSKTVVIESTTDDLDMNSDSDTQVLGKSSDIEQKDISDYLKGWMDTLDITTYIADPALQKPIAKELQRFYNFNGYQLAWSNLDGANSQSKVLLNALAESKDHGLEPDDYHLRELVYTMQQVYSRKKRVNLLDVIHLDMDMTLAYLTYTQHLFNGRINPKDLGGIWEISNKHKELAQYMSNKDVRQVLSMIQPDIPGYNELKQQLANYRSIAESGGWPTLPQSVTLKLGDDGDEVFLLHDRLSKSGDLTRSLKKSSVNPYYFDAELEEAVKSFQRRHGLEPDGIVSQGTTLELNKTVAERIEQIKVNLERIRWMPRDLGNEYLIINIPAYTLEWISSNKIKEKLRVIVGNTFSATPIVNTTMDYIIFSPLWNVPGTLFVRNLMPQAQENPNFLKQNGYVLYATNGDIGKKPLDPSKVDWSSFVDTYPHFKVLQQPGSGDAQGKIKFVIPNNYNIFLSDASSEKDFDKIHRDFNYRCISVENAVSFAEELLDDRKWREDDIHKSMESDRPIKAVLKNKLPFYITYRTCWVDENGKLNFRPDIYGFDAAQYELTRRDSSIADDF